MEIKMNKEIRAYQERSWLNLTMRQIIIGAIGIIFSVYIAFSLRHTFSSATMMGLVGTIVMIPFALIGDFGPTVQGMPFRKFLWVWIRYTYLEPKQLKFIGNNFYKKILETQMQADAAKQKGWKKGEFQTAKERAKRALGHSKKRTSRHSSTDDMERWHFFKRKNLQ